MIRLYTGTQMVQFKRNRGEKTLSCLKYVPNLNKKKMLVGYFPGNPAVQQLREEDIRIGNESAVFAACVPLNVQQQQQIMSVICQQYLFVWNEMTFNSPNYTIYQQQAPAGNVINMTFEISDGMHDYKWEDGEFSLREFSNPVQIRQMNFVIQSTNSQRMEIFHQMEMPSDKTFFQVQLSRAIPQGEKILQILNESFQGISANPTYTGTRFIQQPPTEDAMFTGYEFDIHYWDDDVDNKKFLYYQELCTPSYMFFSQTSSPLYDVDGAGLPIFSSTEENKNNTQNILLMWNKFSWNEDDASKKINILSMVDWIL